MKVLEVGPQDTRLVWSGLVYFILLVVGGTLGLLDFILRALRVLRPCDSRNDAVDNEKSKKIYQLYAVP